jgi:prevent-host-death family protein
MKIVGIKDARLEACVREAQREQVVITRKGKPVAVIVSANGMDLEQLELAYSEKFWKLVDKWRRQKTITREELEKRLAMSDKPPAQK